MCGSTSNGSWAGHGRGCAEHAVVWGRAPYLSGTSLPGLAIVSPHSHWWAWWGTQGRVCWLLTHYFPKDISFPYSPHQFHDLQSQSSHIKEARIFDSSDVSPGPQICPVHMCLSVDCENWKDPQITYDPTPCDIVEALESRDEDNSLSNGRTRTKSQASFSCLMTCTPL